MDYTQTCHHKTISGLKIVKYLLLCTLILLLVGLFTLILNVLLAISSQSLAAEVENQWSAMPCHPFQQCLTYLLADYCIVFFIASIALIALLKENFFFLLASALLNLIFAFVNLFIPSYRWSIIFLQICSALFTLAYTMSVYVKMKLDIRRKKRLEKLAFLRAQLADVGEMDRKTGNLYQSVHSHSYDKLVLTNEWLQSQRTQSSSQNNAD